MKTRLRILIIEDSEDDALLVLRQVKKGGYNIYSERIETSDKMKIALEQKPWDIILSDYHLPHFNGLDALWILKESGIDIPFIIISGAIGEETAVEAMKAGANDYIMKNNMQRLLPVIERELLAADSRAERRLLEQKQKQIEILKKSEEKFKNLVKDMPVGVILRNSQAEVLMSNSYACELLELSEEQLLGKIPFTQGWKATREDGTPLPPYIFPAYQAIADRCPVRGIVMVVYRPIKDDWVWLLVDAIPQLNNDGSIKQVVSTFIDITKQKTTEKALQESESTFRSILYASPDDVTITDLDGHILAVSHSGIELFGYDNEAELLGHSISEYLIQEDVERAMHNISLMFQGVRTGPAEYRATRKDGTIFDIEANAEFIHSADGTPTKIVLIIRNITQRKQAEEKLIKLTTAVEQSPVSIVITDRDGVIEYINPYCVNSTGYNYEEIIGQNPRILKSDKTPAETYKQLWDTISSGNIWRGELCNKKKDGNFYWERISISPVVDNSGYITHYIGVKENITTEKKALEALQESEERHRILFMDSPDAYLILAEGVFIDCNREAQAMLRGSRSQIIGQKPENISPEFQPNGQKSSEAATEKMKTALATGTNNFEWVHRRFDGSEFLVEVSIALITLDGKQALFSAWRDITRRKQAEEALRDSEVRYRQLVESAPDGIAIHQQGKIVYINSEGAKQFGAKNQSDMIGKPILDLVHSDYRNEVIQRIQKTLNNENTPFNEEKFIKLDGTVFDVEVTAIPSVFEGKPATQVVVHDITRRKQTEKQLMLLNFSLDHVKESVFLSDEHGHFIYVNDEACRTLRYSREELLNMRVTDVVRSYPLHNWQSHIEDLKTHGSLTFETRHTTKQGYVFPVENNVCLFEYNKIPYRLALTRDITERKLVEAEIKFKNEELLKLNAQKDKFFSIIAHDLRGPISGFLGLTEIMVEKISSLPMHKIQTFAESMKDSSTSLYRLLENLLEWAQQQQGLIPFNPELISLPLVVKDCIAMVLESAKNKGIEIVYDLPDNIQVLADSNMLQTIIRNLVSNAVKFTPRGGKISLSARAIGHKNIEISIKDTGIGMDNKMVDNLFKLDVRTNRPGTENEPSTGLGLLLCKEFIEKHGGKIWVESQVADLQSGKTGGTTFFFTMKAKT